MLIKSRFTLGKTERLKSRKLIEQMFKDGKSLSFFPLRLLYIFPPNAPNSLQAGFSVSTRNFKRATDRNRIKRLMREAYRLQKNELAGKLGDSGKSLNLFFIYTGNEMPEYKIINEKTEAALKRINKLIDEEDNATA